MEYLGEIILFIITTGLAIAVTVIFKNSFKAVDKKLDTVLKNQEDHKVELEKVKKDVESNATWGKYSKDKITNMEKDINTLNRFMDTSKEKFKNLEKE